MANPNVLMSRLASLMGTTGILLGLPALAQVNPDPSSFNPSLNQHNTVAQTISEPESPQNASRANTSPTLTFKVLFAALEAAGLAATLEGPGPFTVFAPSDQAFAALPAGTLEELLKPEHKATLIKILNYHLVPGQVTSSNLKPGAVPTIEGSAIELQVDQANQEVKVNTAKIILPDVPASNGVIHVIDKVILPPDLLGQSQSSPTAN